MKILYYVTSHGFGHGVRSAAVGNCFSPQVTLLYRTALPEAFFREEMTRPYEIYRGEFDCGCIQHDSVTVDVYQTLHRYHRIAESNAESLKRELHWCADQGVDAVVSDIVPFAFEVARHLGVPSFAATNFTWYDIYAPYAQMMPQFQPVIEHILDQYAWATALLEMEPSQGLTYFRQVHRISPVGRVGVNIRARLSKMAGIDPAARIGLIYPGTFGMESVRWERLEKFTDWHFVGLYDFSPHPANYHVVTKGDFRYQDLTASVDLVISKLGYSTVAECMLNGTPLLYLPREHFAEYPVLDAGVKQWGGGYALTGEEYCALRWDEVLDRVAGQSRPGMVSAQGAQTCARLIETMTGSGMATV